MDIEILPPEVFLAGYPDWVQEAASTLRAVVREAVPDATERVRAGWRLIGYDVPAGRRVRYFAFVAPEPGHIHLGFEYGIFMADPDRLLQGAHLKLRKVRFLTFKQDQPIPERALIELTREAARLAAMTAGERYVLANDVTRS